MTKSKSKGAQKRVKVDNLPKKKKGLTKKDAKRIGGGIALNKELALVNQIEVGEHHVEGDVLQRSSK
jgi:hypothetical protein